MAATLVRVDRDDAGNVEVSSQKPRKLKPIETREPLKGVLKKSVPEPESALRKRVEQTPTPTLPPEEPEVTPELPQKPKKALKSSLKNSKTVPISQEAAEPSSPKTPKVPDAPKKSALKSRPVPYVEQGSEALAPTPERPAERLAAPKATSEVSAVSPIRLSVTNVTCPLHWTTRGLCRWYYYFASQRVLWQHTQLGSNSSKMIDLSIVQAELKNSAENGGAITTQHRGSWKGMRSQHVLLVDDQKSPKSSTQETEESPLKALLTAKKPDLESIRKLLKDLSRADRAKWLLTPLDATPPGLPPPIILAVATVNPQLVKLLVEFGASVDVLYHGKAMFKGWIKPEAPLIECVRNRKGRFVGTMLGERLAGIADIIEQAIADQAERMEQTGGVDMSSQISIMKGPPPMSSAKLAPMIEAIPIMEPGAMARNQRQRKSFQIRYAGRFIVHTHGHPSIKYELTDQISTTRTCSIVDAICLSTNTKYSIKAGRKVLDCGKDQEAELWNEILIMRKLDHPHVVRLMETLEDDKNIFFVFDVNPGGLLLDRIGGDEELVESTCMRLAYQMGSAIRHLHENFICHRDIQAENFMVERRGPLRDNSVRLGDFNTAKDFESAPMLTKHFTLHYVAPEVFSHTAGYSQKIDVWSLGVLIYIMATGNPPFDGDEEVDVLKAISAGTFHFEPEATWALFSEASKDLIKACLVVDASARVGIEEFMRMEAMQRADTEGAGVKGCDFDD